MRNRLLPALIVTILIAVVVSIPVGRAVPARAQDSGGLTAEELALLDRILTARQNFKALTSYTEDITGVEALEMKLTMGTNIQSLSTNVSWERTSDIINEQDSKNVTSHLTATIEDQDTGLNGAPKNDAYTIKADVRRVGGKLYVNAAYDADKVDPQWPELPTGWTEVADISQWAGFKELNLRDYINDKSVFDDIETFKAANPEITSEASTLDDGTPVDIITITFDAEGVKALRAGSPSSGTMGNVLMANLGGDTHARVSIVIDAQNLPRQLESEEVYQVPGLDAAVLGRKQIPAGSTFDYTQSFLRTVTYSAFNTPFEPATVPEGLAQ